MRYLDIVRRPRPTVLDRKEFEAEVPRLIEDWNRYGLVFTIGEIRRIKVKGDKANAVFVLEAKGNWHGLPFTRRVLKKFGMIRRDGGWTILDDRGKWLEGKA